MCEANADASRNIIAQTRRVNQCDAKESASIRKRVVCFSSCACLTIFYRVTRVKQVEGPWKETKKNGGTNRNGHLPDSLANLWKYEEVLFSSLLSGIMKD